MFSKILIANRGKIAVRIIRACKEMGVTAVAVYSEANHNALHVALADQSFASGAQRPPKAISTKTRSSPRPFWPTRMPSIPAMASFPKAPILRISARKNGLVFIGPTPDSMEVLSDKALLKERFADAGLNDIPGVKALASAQASRPAGLSGHAQGVCGRRAGYPADPVL